MKGVLLTLAPLLLAANPASAVPLKLPPIDECGEDASFRAFRSALKEVVARKDQAALLEMLAPDVEVDFGGGSGRKTFAEQWDFDPKEYGNIWDQLETMLRLGCAHSNAARVIPSLMIQLERHTDEDFTDTVVILPGAKLYESTGVESSNPVTVPWSIAPVTSRAGDLVTGVRLPDGRQGYISDNELYEAFGYRMIVEKRDGKWMITAFVAGD